MATTLQPLDFPVFIRVLRGFVTFQGLESNLPKLEMFLTKKEPSNGKFQTKNNSTDWKVPYLCNTRNLPKKSPVMESKEPTERPISLSGVPKYEENPFVLQLKGKMYLQPRANTIIARGQEIVDTTTGEVIQDDVLMGRRRVVDKSQFAKIYASEIGLLFDLSRTAIKVFMYLAKVMDYDQRAYFNYYKEHAKLGYKTYTTCYKGILELLARNIIALDIRENTYWMNPTIVCKGERFAVYTEYVTKERHERDRRRAEQKKMLREQGKQWYDALDDATQLKLQRMNEAAERKEQRAYERSLFPELDKSPYDE